MRYFLLLVLIAFIGGAGYLYTTYTDEYEYIMLHGKVDDSERAAELNQQKFEIESLIEQALGKGDSKPLAPSPAPSEEQPPALPQLSEDTALLQAAIKEKSDLVARKNALAKLQVDLTERQKNYEIKTQTRISDNFKTMEANRNRAYREFEKRMDADTTRMDRGKGARYAKEKRELDAIAAKYQDRVNTQNDQLRAKIQNSRVKLNNLKERINSQITEIDISLKSVELTEDDQKKISRNMNQLARDLKMEVMNTETPESDAFVADFEVEALRQKLNEINYEISSLRSNNSDFQAEAKREYNQKIDNLKLFGIAGGVGLALLTFISFVCARFKE